MNPEDLEKLKETNECPECDLSGANLKFANLEWANLKWANLEGAKLYKAVEDTELLSATDTRADGVDLFAVQDGADLRSVRLREAFLAFANLGGADLSDANLVGAILVKANLDGAFLRSAILCKTIMPDGSVNNSGC